MRQQNSDPLGISNRLSRRWGRAEEQLTSLLENLLLVDSDDVARAAAADSLVSLRALAGLGNRRLVGEAEESVAASPETAFQVQADGTFRLECDAGSWGAGRFDTPSLGQLEDRLGTGSGTLRFFVLDGASPLTDIGWLQATAPSRTFFQVASQFNCLEAPAPGIVPVARYFGDGTQGPRAAIGAFPGTLLRHYFAPSETGGRFSQAPGGPQIDLLRGALRETGVWGGYLTGQGLPEPAEYLRTLESNWLDLRIGAHEALEVVLGADWDGGLPDGPRPRIGHALTSTVAGGLYGADRVLGPNAFQAVARQLLRAAYYGTITAAARGGADWVCLTLVGGGVFGNPVELILESIIWSMDRVQGRLSGDLNVVLNGRDLHRRLSIDDVVLPEVRRRSGLIAMLGESGSLDRIS